MVYTRRSRNTKVAKAVASRYGRVKARTMPLARLVDFLAGIPDPMDKRGRDQLIGRVEWESYDTRKRNRAVGFVERDSLVAPHSLKPPLYFSRTPKNELFDARHEKAIKSSKLMLRYKDAPTTVLAPKYTLPVSPVVGMVPRLKTTPTEDLAVMLNSRLFNFYWRYFYPGQAGKPAIPAEERLAQFMVPMLTKKTGAPFHKVRDKILKLGRENANLLGTVDQVQKIADRARIQAIPIGETEGMIREINVPRPLGSVASVKRRGPVVVFQRGSTIVTTTEEAATYLEFWLAQRFDQLDGMTREQLEEYIRMPVSTAHVVEVLQHRAKIEAEIDATQRQIRELQTEADDHLNDLYALDENERAYLVSAFP
ncbi:MAG: hypothetical protein KAI97_07035 [Gemmatimonadetes bacterium]|nr:hypothetical protein [Gemmatimonadota bacterium]